MYLFWLLIPSHKLGFFLGLLVLVYNMALQDFVLIYCLLYIFRVFLFVFSKHAVLVLFAQIMANVRLSFVNSMETPSLSNHFKTNPVTLLSDLNKQFQKWCINRAQLSCIETESELKQNIQPQNWFCNEYIFSEKSNKEYWI